MQPTSLNIHETEGRKGETDFAVHSCLISSILKKESNKPDSALYCQTKSGFTLGEFEHS